LKPEPEIRIFNDLKLSIQALDGMVETIDGAGLVSVTVSAAVFSA
jgi:hypothetical protein